MPMSDYETGNSEVEECIHLLERDLIEAIELKNFESLSNIRNKAMNLNFRIKDKRLELMQAVAIDMEIFVQRDDDYVPPDIGRNMSKEWEPSWWPSVKETAAQWQKYHDEQHQRREEGKRIGIEDDFIAFADFKPLPMIYWSEKREIFLPVILNNYISAKGGSTTRQVDIETFCDGFSDCVDVYFVGFCHLRNAARTFYASRAESITVTNTGEIFRDVNEFRYYIGKIYSDSLEGQLDRFFGEYGAEIAEIVMFIGRIEGNLKNRVKSILMKRLSIMSGFSIDDIKTSKVYKAVFKAVGFDSRDFKQSVKSFGEKVYKNPELYFLLENTLNDIIVDGKGVVDELMAALVRKTLKKVAPPPDI